MLYNRKGRLLNDVELEILIERIKTARNRNDLVQTLDDLDLRYETIIHHERVRDFVIGKNVFFGNISNLKLKFERLARILKYNQNVLGILNFQLSTLWKDEFKNKQVGWLRHSFLHVFHDIMNIMNCNATPFSAISFFTLTELFFVKLMFKKKDYFGFLHYFTDEEFLMDFEKKGRSRIHQRLEYFIGLIEKKRSKIYVQYPLFKNKYQAIITQALKKLKNMQKLKRMTRSSSNTFIPALVSTYSMKRYRRWCMKVGWCFSDRKEFDFSNYFIMTSIQENLLKREKYQKYKVMKKEK